MSQQHGGSWELMVLAGRMGNPPLFCSVDYCHVDFNSIPKKKKIPYILSVFENDVY